MVMYTHKDKVLSEVHFERERQDNKWGVQNHDPYFWYSILGEEFGEIGKALCEKDFKNYREELIQTAAVCVAMLECLDRNGVS